MVIFQALGSRLQKLPAQILQVKRLSTSILSMPGWDLTDYYIFSLDFYHTMLYCYLHSVGIGSPIQICSILVGVCSPCVNIVSCFLSLRFTSFVKTSREGLHRCGSFYDLRVGVR